MIQVTGQKKASITRRRGVCAVGGIRFPVTSGEFVVVPGSPGMVFCRDPDRKGTTDVVMLIFGPDLIVNATRFCRKITGFLIMNPDSYLKRKARAWCTG